MTRTAAFLDAWPTPTEYYCDIREGIMIIKAPKGSGSTANMPDAMSLLFCVRVVPNKGDVGHIAARLLLA